MAVDVHWLAKHGVSAKSYKKIFDGDPLNYPPRVKKLVELLAARNRDGIKMGLREWQAYAAVDLAYEVPFNQTTPTLVQNILSKRLNAEGTLEALKEWGLSESELFMEIPDATGQRVKVLNPPVFFQIFIPIVKAYVSNVLAQIYNERNQSPLLVYDPLKDTTRNRVLCEIITDMIEVVSTNFGYPAVLKQAIHQMLKYGLMIAFPREEWYCEEQLQDDGTAKGKPVTIKEGLRYTHPHPTKFFYDLKHPLTSLNTDTGTEYIGYWHILSYGDILDNRLLWNRKKIFSGTNWFNFPGAANYFREVFPCRVDFPHNDYRSPDREDKAAYYNTGNRDQSVFVVEQFAKINPKEWGLGRYEDGKLVDSYNYPVWHRFTMAGDNSVLWAEPCAYVPGWFMGYDYDEMAGMNSSLGLELIPWQDHLGMILSQMILTARQNLMNVVFYDNQIVDKTDIEKLQNSGENKYRSINFISFDSLKRRMAQTDINRAFIPVQLSKVPIQEQYNLIPIVLNMLERVMAISSQQAGSAATHQQSKEEVIRTGQAGDARRTLTASSVDEGGHAWKNQIVTGYKAYGDAGVSAQVSADIEDIEEHVRELGFTIEQGGKRDKKLLVKGKKSALKLEHFARSGPRPDTTRDREVANVIFQAVATIASQPALQAEMGVKNLLTLIEQASKFAGAPRDFKLLLEKHGSAQQIAPQLQQALQALGQNILQAVEEKIARPSAEQMARLQSEVGQQQQVIEQLKKIYDVAAKTQEQSEIKAREAQAETERKNWASAQEQQRRNEEFAQEERRKEEEHQADLRREAEKAALDAQLKAAEAKEPVPA